MPDDYVLLTAVGPDRPGITHRLTDAIARTGIPIVDIGQAVTYECLSLSILVDPTDAGEAFGELTERLSKEARSQGLHLSHQSIAREAKKARQLEKFVLSCVCPGRLTAAFLSDLSKTLSVYGINIHRIDNCNPGERRLGSLDILTTAAADLDQKKLKAHLFEISGRHHTDIAFLPDRLFKRDKRLIVFDMDSTLVETELIDEMARAHGVGTEVESITERAMNGEIDFDRSLVERVEKLKGFEVDKMQSILDGLSYTPGCREFVETVKSLGFKTAVISGGFSFFASALKERLGLDYAFANELETGDGKLTGRVAGRIINADQKALLLKRMARQENITLEQVVAIGDGANDLPMLSAAGLGIAYHAKDAVRRQAQHHMSYGPMTSILHFLGIQTQPPISDK